MEQAQAKFEGWAIVELMGHQREIGFVTTQYFGGAAMFQVDCPEFPERDYVLERPEWVQGKDGGVSQAPKGSTVRRPSIPARTRIVNPSAIYALNPCTEETARKAMEREQKQDPILLNLPEAKPAELTAGDESMQPECGCGAGESCELCNPEYPI